MRLHTPFILERFQADRIAPSMFNQLSLRGAQRPGNLDPVPHWIEIAASLRSSQ
jgi:hypothetical protein